MSLVTLKPAIVSWVKINRFSIVTAFVLLVFILLLDMNRLQSGDDVQKQLLATSYAEPLVLPSFTADAYALLESTYKNFSQNQEQQSDAKARAMSVAEQEKQQGELRSLFVGDNQLKLKAVVSYNVQQENNALEKAYYALIEVKDLTKGERVVQKYQHKDDVFGYQLIIKQNQQVQLVAQSGEAKRIINLVMYQITKKSPKNANKQALSNQNNINESSE